MSTSSFPEGFSFEPLRRNHPRGRFCSGERAVDQWLATRALQHQEKRLSVTRVLIGPDGRIAGYYTLVTGQIAFTDLPAEIARRLPKRILAVVIIAWLGVSRKFQQQGLGKRLLARALRDCYDAGRTFAFIAVILDCIDDSAKDFYQQFGFEALPGFPNRLFVTASQLEAMMNVH